MKEVHIGVAYGFEGKVLNSMPSSLKVCVICTRVYMYYIAGPRVV